MNDSRQSLSVLVLSGLLLLLAQSAHAQEKLSILKVDPPTAGLGSTLKVTIKNWPKDKPAPSDWILYLDGVPLTGTKPDNTDASDGVLRFSLQYERSKPAWAILLRDRQFERPVTVAVGPASGVEKSIEPLASGFKLVVIPLWPFVLLLMGVLVLVLFIGSRSNLLRDSDTSATNKPFSLGRVQMAFWFVIIWASYLYIGLVTWDYSSSMNSTALILMGISAATGLGAVLIDSDKQKQTEALKAEKAALPAQVTQLQTSVAAATVVAAAPANPAAATNLVVLNNDLHQKETRLNEVNAQVAKRDPTLTLCSGGWIDDLLLDADGLRLHRLQIVVWTLTLGGVFVGGVINYLAMPEFNATLLALMGISSGVYVGFKFPERKA